MTKRLLIVSTIIAIIIGARFDSLIERPVTVLAQTNTFCAANLACTVSSTWTFNSTANLIPCVSTGFYLSASSSCYATVQAAITAACALSPVGTVTIPPGTYTGPTTFCSNLKLIGLSPGESRAAVGNLGVTPLTAATPVSLTYATSLNLSGLQNMNFENLQFDFGSCTGCSFILTSSSFNQFKYVTLNNVGDTAAGQAALLVTVLNGTGAQFGSVWNSFDHLRINCNAAASHYCYAAVELLGAGSVNVAPAAFATLNHFWDLGVTGQYKYCIDAELNSDTNYFWGVDCNENASPVPTNSAVLAFNLITPASDQDADGGVYDGVIVAGLGPTSFIRAGQSNGNRISISQGSAGPPSLVNVGGTPLYTVQNIGLPGVNSNFYVGGSLESLGAMNLVCPSVAGTICSAVNATQGNYYFGTDGSNLVRSGNTLLLQQGAGTMFAFSLPEQASGSACVSGQDVLLGNLGTHQLDLCNNGGSLFQVAQDITATSAAFATATTTGTCVQNTTAVSGATTGMAVAISPVSTPGVGAQWSAFVSSAGNVTINECAVATSAGGTIAFNIRVIP